MGEVKTLSFGEEINYSGIINAKGLYNALVSFLSERDYSMVELLNEEHVYEDGRQVILVLEPYREISEYAKAQFHIEIVFKKLQDIVVPRGKIKEKTFKGEVNISFTTQIITDLKGDWSAKPVYFFFKTLLENFVYGGLLSKYEEEIIVDKNNLMREVRSYLNMQTFK